MALIKCNNCGRSVSDRATVCPHCGCDPHGVKEANAENDSADTNSENEQNSNLTTCPHCGALVSKKADVCPKCGKPTIVNFNQSQNIVEGDNSDVDEYEYAEEKTANHGLLSIVGILTIIALVFAGFLYSGNRYYKGRTFKFIIDTCAVDTDSCNVDTCAIDSLPNTTSSERDFISFDDLMVSEPSNECHYDIRGVIEVKKALQQKGYELVSTQRKDIEMEGDETLECVYYTYVLKTSDGDILNKVEFESPINGIGVDNISITFADNKDKENFVEQIHNSNYVETDRVGEVGIMWGDKHTIAIYYNGI